MRELVVNADDLGLSPGVNHGIARAHLEGIVTSASLMVRQPAAEHAAELVHELPSLGVGLHVDLAEWVAKPSGWTPLYAFVDDEDELAVAQEVEQQLLLFESLVGRTAGPSRFASARAPVRAAPLDPRPTREGAARAAAVPLPLRLLRRLLRPGPRRPAAPRCDLPSRLAGRGSRAARRSDRALLPPGGASSTSSRATASSGSGSSRHSATRACEMQSRPRGSRSTRSAGTRDAWPCRPERGPRSHSSKGASRSCICNGLHYVPKAPANLDGGTGNAQIEAVAEASRAHTAARRARVRGSGERRIQATALRGREAGL